MRGAERFPRLFILLFAAGDKSKVSFLLARMID
jgi:hypothetical protein